MDDSTCVDYLESLIRLLVEGSRRTSKYCNGEAVEYQQKCIQALRYAIAKVQSSSKGD